MNTSTDDVNKMAKVERFDDWLLGVMDGVCHPGQTYAAADDP